MKVFRYVYLLLAIPLLAGVAHAEAPWGILRYPVEKGTFSVYAIDNLLGNRPIHYTVGPNVTPQEEEIFKNNIRKWPADTLRLIQKRGRTQEFQDIIPILERGRDFVLQPVPLSAPPDIYLNLAERAEDCGPTAVGCFDEKGRENPYSSILVVEKHRAEFEGISLHEVGHYFGLGDQYSDGLDNSHREYSSPVNTTQKAIMQGHTVTDSQITEDDADGFINLIDLRLAQRNGGRFSKRARNSWKSLDPDSPNIYQEGHTVNRPSVSVRETDETTLVVNEYKNGKFQKGNLLSLPDDPLYLFTFSPGQDKVQREKDSPFIRAIHKTVQVMTEFANGTSAVRQVPYKISFSYGKPFVRNGKKAVTISVGEFLDGREINSQEVTLFQDKEVTGIKRLQLESDSYMAHTTDNDVRLSFRNGLSGDFSCTLYEMHQKIWHSQAGTGHLIDNGRERTVSLPPAPNSRAQRYWDICNKRKNAIAAFYQNFYEPLFNTTQSEMQTQVKQAMGTRR
ncbi:MAG: hypothetical protein MJ053_05660 [Elusimicrobiaceae bacterium]|nr:hypothetical protein [Elusimicrobiaceae bacterium]